MGHRPDLWTLTMSVTVGLHANTKLIYIHNQERGSADIEGQRDTLGKLTRSSAIAEGPRDASCH